MKISEFRKLIREEVVRVIQNKANSNSKRMNEVISKAITVIVVDKGQNELDVEEAFAPYTVHNIKKGTVKRPGYTGSAFTLQCDSKEEEFGTDMRQELMDLIVDAGYRGEVLKMKK